MRMIEDMSEGEDAGHAVDVDQIMHVLKTLVILKVYIINSLFTYLSICFVTEMPHR